MSALEMKKHRLTVEQLVEAVVKRDPDEVAQILNPLRRSELETVLIILAAHDDGGEHRNRVIVRMAGRAFGLTAEDLEQPRRDREAVDGRAVAAYALRLFDVSYPAIGKILGGRDHTTAINAVTRAGDTPRLRGIATSIATEVGWQRPEDGAA